MLIEGFVSMFSECGVCLFVSISRIRLLKKTYTATITTSAIKVINMIKVFFRICMVTVTTKMCLCKIAFGKRCLQVLKATKSGQKQDKMLTGPDQNLT
jgi:hypothetical protein